MNKKVFILIFSMVLMVCFWTRAACAVMGMEHTQCSMPMRHGGLEGSFYEFAHCILARRGELQLTDKQAGQIRQLVAEVQKNVIQMDARIETLAVEINTLMWETPFDTEKVNSLIAEKYRLKKDKAQYLVSAHDRLNKILTDEQLRNLRCAVR